MAQQSTSRCKHQVTDKLPSVLHSDLYSHVSDVIKRSCEQMFTKLKLGQQEKLQSLVDKNRKSTSDIDFSGTQLKGTVSEGPILFVETLLP